MFKADTVQLPLPHQEAAEIEGMQHLLAPNPSHTQEECTALATKLGLGTYTTTTEGCARLARLANIIAAHPTIVSPSIPAPA